MTSRKDQGFRDRAVVILISQDGNFNINHGMEISFSYRAYMMMITAQDAQHNCERDLLFVFFVVIVLIVMTPSNSPASCVHLHAVYILFKLKLGKRRSKRSNTHTFTFHPLSSISTPAAAGVLISPVLLLLLSHPFHPILSIRDATPISGVNGKRKKKSRVNKQDMRHER
jgi:hypothetical protein